MATKKQREIILAKSKGKCWYCGCELKKGWHVDHVEPLHRNAGHHKDNPVYKDRDSIENMVPSCPQCNLFKGGFSLEGFRNELELQVLRVRAYSTNFRMAEKYGLVAVKKEKITFYFETLLKQERTCKCNNEVIK